MRAGLFWLNERQWARIEPHLPTGLTGPHRDDDRRIISGIIHMLQSGARWRVCPREYGPYMTIYNRFNRWAKRGRWCAIFEALANTGEDGVVGGASARTSGAAAISASWPGVRCKTTGRQSGSLSAWIFVVRPPRERPIA
jgi:transposase